MISAENYTAFVFQRKHFQLQEEDEKSATLKQWGSKNLAFSFNVSPGTSASASFSVYSNFKRISLNPNGNYLQSRVPKANPFPKDSNKNR